MRNDRDEEFAFFCKLTGGLTVAVLLIELVGILQRNLFKCTDIHGHIMPTGLVDVVIDVLGLHHTDGSQSIIDTITVGIGHVVTLYPALDVIFGHIEPETDSASILQLDGVAIHTKSDPCVVTGIGFLGSKTVDLQAHGVITVMNLTVALICQGQLQVVIAVIIGSAVDDIPLINVNLTILKVPKNLGGLSQFHRDSGRGVIADIQGSGYGSGIICGSSVFGNRGEEQSIELSERFVCRGERNVACAETNGLLNVVDGCGRLYRNLSGLTERNRYHRLLKVNLIGGNDGDGLLTNDLAVVNHLNGHGAFGAVGGKYTVINGAHTFFFDLPQHFSRNIYLCTNGVRAKSIEGYLAAGRVIIVIGAHGRADKLTVRRCGRNDQNGVGGGALTAVGQRTVDLQILTGTLRAEGGGSAAVTVCGNDTAHLDHVLSHLVGGKSGGVGGLLTVGNSDHKRSVSPYADKGSGGDTGAVVFLGVLSYDLTLTGGSVRFYQKIEKNGDRLLFPTGQRIGRETDPGFGHICGSGFACDRMIVVVDDDDGLYTAAVLTLHEAAVRIELTIKNGVAERLADQLGMFLVVCLRVPAERAVGRNDDVTIAELFRLKSLRGGGLRAKAHRPIAVFVGLHSLGSGNNLNEGVVNVHDCGVKNLSSGTGIVIQNLLVLLNAGSNIPFSFGNDVVVITSSVAVIVNAGSKSIQRENSEKHDWYKQQ